MLRLLDYIKDRKDRKKTTHRTLSQPVFTEKEKQEITATLHLHLRNSSSEDFGTFCVGEDVDGEHLKAAADFFRIQEPEAWEENILRLEKGEFSAEMPEAAFKRWKKERCCFPVSYL